MDDEPDIAMTLKLGFREAATTTTITKLSSRVYSYTDPVEALSNFTPNFYDLLLVDMTMLLMNGFELCEKMLLIRYEC